MPHDSGPPVTDPEALSVRTEALLRAEAKNARLAAAYAALTSVHAVAAQLPTSEKLLDRACTALVKDTAFDAAWAAIVTRDGLVRVVSRAGALSALPDILPSPTPPEPWTRAFETQQAIVWRSTDPETPGTRLLRHDRLLCCLLVPVSTDEPTKGVLCIGSRHPDTFDADETAVLMELGRSLTTHTERIAAERALAAQRELLRAVFDCASYGIYYAAADQVILLCNDALLRLTGYARGDLVGRKSSEITAVEFCDVDRKTAEGVVSSGLPSELEKDLVRADGSRIPVRVSLAPVRDRSGSVVGVVSIVRDTVAERDAKKELLALNEMLEEKVAARTRELEEANAALAHAGRMKDEFLANMSHELRTPLNSILGLADALLEGVYGAVEEQKQQVLMTISDAGKHLLALINDILDLSKIEAGRLELDMRSISVAEICQASLRMIRPLAIKKRIGTWMRTDPKCRIVVADERRLKQMLVNLLSNAVKFTPPSGQTGVEAWCLDTEIFFSVTDTGIGISPLDLRRIFEPFTQIDSSLTRKHEGTGLGLALVRKLAGLHGGRVEVDSEPGQGSRFTIVLPRVEPPEHDSAPPSEKS